MRLFAPLSLTVLSALAASACGGSQPTPTEDPPMTQTAAAPTTSTPTDGDASVPSHQVDPVAEGMTKLGAVQLCDRHLERAAKLRDELRGLKSAADAELTWDATLGRIDAIAFEVALGAGMPELMSLTHPDKEVRDAAKGCRPKVDKFYTNLLLDADLAGVVKRYAERDEAKALTGTKKRLLDELLRDFRRNGLDLPKDKQEKLKKLNAELTKLSQEFGTNISESKGELKVKPEQLKGMPESFRESHKAGDDGMVTLTTDYPDYYPIVTHCEDREVAKDLTRLFDNRAADKNVKILERVLVLRQEKAELLGYETWADYAIEPRMAKSKQSVADFLKKAAETVKAPARAEYAAFVAEHQRLGGKLPIPNYDRLYLEQRLRQKKYNFDSKELSNYFEVERVTAGMLKLLSQLFGVEFKQVDGVKTWHEDVRVIDVLDSAANGGKRRARIYLDLFPREGKYKHAAMFEMRSGMAHVDGYITPISALVCNFTRTTADAPGLLTHNQVQTYFHEFGHALHHAFTSQPLASFAGTNTARDFVEAPSQMLEEWTWRRETLDLFAVHHETGEKIPDALFEAMTKSRAFGRAVATERQISLATLDFEYHSQKPPLDTDEVFTQVMKKTQSFSYLPDTHFQATFGHLMGYDAAYYGYQWALAIARDVLTRFEKEGFMNTKTAADWRSHVLAQGAGPDENELVAEFLGRPTNLDAYGKFLSGK